MFHVPHPYVLATLAALLPMAAAWYSGVRLMRRLDDPMLSERFMAHQRRNGVLLVAGFIAVVMFQPQSLPWTVPLLFSGSVAAAYPLRRAIYGETWAFSAYMRFFHWLTFAVFGHWVTLAALPAIASLGGSADWLVGVIGAAILLVWNHRYADVIRWALPCRELDEGPLLTRCRELAARCGLPQPAYLRVEVRGGVIANALALPSLRGNAVLFTSTVLGVFPEDEVVAICGHELAHFEYYDRRRLRALNRATILLILFGMLVAPAARLVAGASFWVYIGWSGALLGVLALRGKDKQRQETVCDARAVELVGGSEPVVSALTRLYALARLPRRMDLQQERAASHPSLARRIRDVRRAAGVPPATVSEPVSVDSADGKARVTFDTAVLQWRQEAGVTQVINYSHLLELRLDARLRGGPRLRAHTEGRRQLEMRLLDADLPRVQALLDSIDGQLGDMPQPRGLPLKAARLLVVFTSLIAIVLGQLTVAAVTVIAWLRPAASLLAGAAAAALTGAVLVFRDQPRSAGLAESLVLVAAILLAVALLTRDQETRSTKPHLTAMCVLAALLIPALFVYGAEPIRIHQAARAMPGLTALLAAIATALAWSATPRRRAAAAVAAAAAMALAGVSSLSFLDRFVSDPFLVESPEIVVSAIEASDAEEFELPEATTRVQLSRGGRFVAALEESDGDDAHAATFHLGRLGDALTTVSGDSVHFLDDETAVIAETDPEGTALRQVRLNSSLDVLWRQKVRRLQGGSLTVTAKRDWQLEGWDTDEAIVRADGTIGAMEFHEKRWPAKYTRDVWINAMTTAGPDPIVVETRYDRGLLERLPPRGWLFALMLHSGTQSSRYWSLGDSGVRVIGESKLGADCDTGMMNGDLICTVYDGGRTRIMRLDASTGSISGIGWVAGRFIGDGAAVDGWLVGWQDSTAVALDLANRRMLRLPRSEGVAGGLSVGGGRLAAIVMDGERCRLRVYSIPPAAGNLASRSASATR